MNLKALRCAAKTAKTDYGLSKHIKGSVILVTCSYIIYN